ncbi:MAG: Gfo/Idh/MocA family oxidoreductase [Bacteroidota bacterium]
MNFNRRKFIYYTSLAGMGLSLGGCKFKNKQITTSKAQANTKGKIGVALVGLGYYSRDLLAPALQLTNHCYLAGIVTGSPEKIPVWQEKYGIKDSNVYNYGSMHTIADNDEIDVIYIVLPTGLHAKYSILAANAGKHVWCEKPMAMNVKECQSIIDACNKNKVKLSIGYRMQHEPNTQTVIKYAKTKPYGAIEKVTSMAGYSSGGGKGWRFQKELGGGALYDMGVYTINGIRYATDMEPVRVLSATHSTKRPKIFTEVDETTEYQLEFTNGLVAYGKTSVGETFNQLRVDCENGWYELSPMQSYKGVQGETSDGTLLNKPIDNQQARQMDNDALAILNDTSVLVPGSEGLKDIRIVNAIQAAAAKGAKVEIA